MSYNRTWLQVDGNQCGSWCNPTTWDTKRSHCLPQLWQPRRCNATITRTAKETVVIFASASHGRPVGCPCTASIGPAHLEAPWSRCRNTHGHCKASPATVGSACCHKWQSPHSWCCLLQLAMAAMKEFRIYCPISRLESRHVQPHAYCLVTTRGYPSGIINIQHGERLGVSWVLYILYSFKRH